MAQFNVPLPLDLNEILRANSKVILSPSIPAAPSGQANVMWQVDEFGNISAYAPAGGAPFAVDVTQPPYNAKGDGVTDDSAAIQAALNANEAIFLPGSTSGPRTYYLGTTGITLGVNPFAYSAIYGNGQILSYSGSGNMITIGSGSQLMTRVQDLIVDASAATGTPTLFNIAIGQQVILDNVTDFTSLTPASYNFLSSSGTFLTVTGLYTFGNVSVSEAPASFINAQMASLTNSGGVYMDATSVTYPGGIDLEGGALFCDGSSTYGDMTSTSGGSLSGSLTFQNTATPSIASNITGQYSYLNNAGAVFNVTSGVQTNKFYSASGTPIPAASAANAGVSTFVSDATVATLGAAYVSGGTNRVPVFSSGTAWLMG
jgi:hypothetical protein